jgi:hypothetical protein
MRRKTIINRLCKTRKVQGAFEEPSRTSPLVNDNDLFGQGGVDGGSPPSHSSRLTEATEWE